MLFQYVFVPFGTLFNIICNNKVAYELNRKGNIFLFKNKFFFHKKNPSPYSDEGYKISAATYSPTMQYNRR